MKNEIKRKRSNFERIILWFITIVLTAAITWYITNYLNDTQKTKVYEYTFHSDAATDTLTKESADCWEGASNRSDVFKCSTKSSIYAPCFKDVIDASSKVKCPRSPYDDQDVRYFKANFSKDLKPTMDSYEKQANPWYIVLSSGEKCGFLYGATNLVANKRMDFGCEKSPVTLYLPTSKDNEILDIGCMKNNRLERCNIQEIWY